MTDTGPTPDACAAEARIARLEAALLQIAGPIKPDKHGTALHERMRQIAREALACCTKCGVTPPAPGSDTCRGCIDALSRQAHDRECERAAMALLNERQRRA